ncbi:hypothetical protein DFR50_10163 [Roseiarcus fermentans]|uniref:Uncharacterized protein n=1 Tax=Roseiarcus fermentans TaxID=1473586 RepID=A0A366FUC2_9HYPH|nr:hypothetical protein [Roseiarcus fermentans]RBP18121.1 hypothetical protein DFR50_10163 [Roseiarcus fermentans]
MSGKSSWFVLLGIILAMLGGCTAMAGDLQTWPASLTAVAIMLVAKIVNDRVRIVKWPMEFLFWSAMTMIVCNLAYLYLTA